MKQLVNVRVWVLGFILMSGGVFLLFITGEKLGHDGWRFLYDIAPRCCYRNRGFGRISAS